MDYHLNFNFVWKYADKLWWGLALSIQLALIGILIGCVIGLALALAHSGGNRWTRGAVAAYVEFVRNVPLLLLVFWATGHRLSDVPSDEQWMIHGTLWILTFVCNFFAVKQILKLMLQAKRAGAGGV